MGSGTAFVVAVVVLGLVVGVGLVTASFFGIEDVTGVVYRKLKLTSQK